MVAAPGRLSVLVVVGSLALTVLTLPRTPAADAETEVAARIPTGGVAPLNVAVNPTLNRAYVTSFTTSTLTVIDMATNQAIGSPIPIAGSAVGVVVNPVNNRVYVSSRSTDDVTVLDGTTLLPTPGSPVSVGVFPELMAVNPVTNRVYVANVMADTISIVDGSTNAIIPPTISVGDNPVSIGINTATNRLYVANRDDATLSVIDGATSSVIGSPIALGALPFGVAVNSVTNRVYVTTIGPGPGNMAVRMIDGATSTVIGSPIVFGVFPLGVAVNEATNRVYVVIAGGDALRVIDGSTFTALGPDVPIGDAPHGLAINPITNRIYVANALVDDVSIVGIPLSTSPTGIRGSKVPVSWSSLFGPSGSDRIGLFQVGAPNSSPLNVRFTNGTSSAGGPGLASGTLVLPIPIGLTPGPYEVRLLAGSTTGTLAVTSLNVLVGPIGEDDSYSTPFGTPLVVPAPGVLANDVSGNGPALQAVQVSGPTRGTLALQPNGGFTYTPFTNVAGPDSFTYRADDGTVQSILVTVTIEVTKVICGPRPRVQVTSAPSGTGLQVTVTASDTGPPTQNILHSLRFDALDNATVTLGGQIHPLPFTHTPPAGATIASFSVQRVAAGVPSTVHFTVTDACGTWPSFVGGGTKAGF